MDRDVVNALSSAERALSRAEELMPDFDSDRTSVEAASAWAAIGEGWAALATAGHLASEPIVRTIDVT
jgi:hypothetical protein